MNINITKYITIIFFSLLFLDTDAQTRYLDNIFTDVNITEIDTFAINVSIEPMLFGSSPALMPIECDIYEPVGDVVSNRPVIIISHSGSFIPPVGNGQPIGSIKDSSIVEQCIRWAKKGYVAVAMGNRKGWFPQSPDFNVRASSYIQAIYRGVQDAKSMVRYLRMTEVNGNPYGINPNKIVLGGQGTGGYISLAYASLDDQQELDLPKFTDLTDPQNPIPYISPISYGNIAGDEFAYLGIFSSTGVFIGVDSNYVTSYPNYPEYSNEINMAFNIGGALADISWMDTVGIPIVSFHCEKDPVNPIDTGDLIIDFSGAFLMEVMGSRTVQHYANLYGHNDVFINAGLTDIYTNIANTNNNGYEGLYVFKTTPPSNQPNSFGESEVEQHAPWEWWDNVSYDSIFTSFYGTQIGYGAANSILANPDMSASKGRTYIDTIQGYLNPRIYIALNLGGTSSISINNALDFSTRIYPNPANNELNIENNNFIISSIELFDISGKSIVVKRVNEMATILDISNLSNGIYFVKVNSNQSSIMKKLIVD